jgi:hypothetical protein
MNLITPLVSLTNPRQGKLAPAAEPKIILEWQDGPATDLGFRQQKLRLSFARGPLQEDSPSWHSFGTLRA